MGAFLSREPTIARVQAGLKKKMAKKNWNKTYSFLRSLTRTINSFHREVKLVIWCSSVMLFYRHFKYLFCKRVHLCWGVVGDVTSNEQLFLWEFENMDKVSVSIVCSVEGLSFFCLTEHFKKILLFSVTFLLEQVNISTIIFFCRLAKGQCTCAMTKK